MADTAIMPADGAAAAKQALCAHGRGQALDAVCAGLGITSQPTASFIGGQEVFQAACHVVTGRSSSSKHRPKAGSRPEQGVVLTSRMAAADDLVPRLWIMTSLHKWADQHSSQQQFAQGAAIVQHWLRRIDQVRNRTGCVDCYACYTLLTHSYNHAHPELCHALPLLHLSLTCHMHSPHRVPTTA
jgi:hypothetical protein